MHGEVHRIPEDSAAFGARAAVANVSALAIWDDPADDEAQIAWARASAARWEPFSLQGGGYVNYSAADETASRVEQAYGAERFARLRAVKRRVDPENRFRFNANIPPA
jgi:FAD/FMN-containing dehydrogenase